MACVSVLWACIIEYVRDSRHNVLKNEPVEIVCRNSRKTKMKNISLTMIDELFSVRSSACKTGLCVSSGRWEANVASITYFDDEFRDLNLIQTRIDGENNAFCRKSSDLQIFDFNSSSLRIWDPFRVTDTHLIQFIQHFLSQSANQMQLWSFFRRSSKPKLYFKVLQCALKCLKAL